MSTARVDALEVIYEDDDEGAVSSNGSDEEDYEDDDHHTSLHGHPDHLHSGGNGENKLSEKKILQALRAENKELRSHLTVLAREVERADTELARWRAKYRKIEDERDALKREFSKLTQAKSQESTSRDSSRSSQYKIVYSTPDADSSDSTHSSRQQKSDNTNPITSIFGSNSNAQPQASPPGIPVHRGRLRQHSVPPDTLKNTHDTFFKEPSRSSVGDISNGALSTRPLNSEALPFSPSWLGPKVPAKESPVNSKRDDVKNHNFDPSVVINSISHPSNPLKPPPKDDISLLTPEGRLGSSPGLRASSPNIIPLSQQTNSPTSNPIRPIQPPRQNSTESLGRSASTASTISNSSSHTSAVSSGVSPSSSQPISPTSYSPKKRASALVNPSLLEPTIPVTSDGFQSGALIQTLRGRAKDILEGRASPGIVHSSERSSLAQSSDASVPTHPIFVNENSIPYRIDTVEDSETITIQSKLVTGIPNASWVDGTRMRPSTTDNALNIDIEDERAGQKQPAIQNLNNYRDVDGRLRNAESKNSVPRPNESILPNREMLARATNATFQEHVDLNKPNNNLMVDLFVQSMSHYPYTNTNAQTLPTNEENGFMYPMQLQFARALTPGSKLSNTSGLPVSINGAPLFNAIPVANRNAISTQNVPIGLPNILPMDARSFPSDTITASAPRNSLSMSGIQSNTVRSQPFIQFSSIPVLQDDPEYGPVIVHGPLPPRHQHGHGTHHSSPRRKREPTSVPPRHLGLSTNMSSNGVNSKRTVTRQDLDGGPSSGVGYGW